MSSCSGTCINSAMQLRQAIRLVASGVSKQDTLPIIDVDPISVVVALNHYKR